MGFWVRAGKKESLCGGKGISKLLLKRGPCAINGQKYCSPCFTRYAGQRPVRPEEAFRLTCLLVLFVKEKNKALPRKLSGADAHNVNATGQKRDQPVCFRIVFQKLLSKFTSSNINL